MPFQVSPHAQKKSFLLLQGVASPFFAELEKALIKAGHQSLKINFCGGDLLSGRFFSTALNHINFQKSLNELPEFYLAIFKEHNITDIALFGDTRPVHVPAIELAKQQGIEVHVFEEGYFRPNWVTLDGNGVNAYSKIYEHSENEPEWFLELAKRQPDWQDESKDTGGNLAIRAWHDIRYHLAKTLLKPMFPKYETHRPDSPLQEYWGFIRRMPMVSLYYKRQSNQQIKALIASHSPFYLLPLQLEADSQIRLHSDFTSLEHVIQTTIESFATNATNDAKLVIKLHPLDPWFINYPKIIDKLCTQYQVNSERVIYLEAGNLNTLLNAAQGTILVNSTVGTSALALGCPVIALGSAIYDIPSLTFQGKLDDFWSNAEKPNAELFQAFKQTYIQQTQINGSFYNLKGIRMAVDSAVNKLAENTSKLSSGSSSAESTFEKPTATDTKLDPDQLVRNSG
ncbi:capsule biosynthesis protein [uncultured Cocleimonas sp.]|uniref:capsule biosynthesis protein n=1 Tax=uncultured Cocleimonas sp. TaxID=1051587 RepID=UPI00263668CF|nr:capsular biosynthesis protein [uncultured Cocleimonas sp.]